MKRVVGLLLLAMVLAWGCAETNSSSATVGRAAMCAMCGASVQGDYFSRTTDRSIGPGQGW